MTPIVSVRRHRRDFPILLPALLVLVGLAVLAVTLPLAGVHVPGMGRVSRMIDSIQFPWEPPKPVHVPLPEGAAPAGAAPAAQMQPTIAAPAGAAPAAPTVPTPHPALSQPLPTSYT